IPATASEPAPARTDAPVVLSVTPDPSSLTSPSASAGAGVQAGQGRETNLAFAENKPGTVPPTAAPKEFFRKRSELSGTPSGPATRPAAPTTPFYAQVPEQKGAAADRSYAYAVIPPGQDRKLAQSPAGGSKTNAPPPPGPAAPADPYLRSQQG